MKSFIVIFIGLVFPLLGFSNNFTQPYEWDKERARIKLTAAEESMSELVLKNHVQYNYGFEKEDFVMHSVVHKIIFVNNSEAIQKHNRITISMYNTIELIDLRARAINKDGKVVLFDKSNLKEVKNEESGNAYRIFAIEGIETGSEIEYYYIRKMNSSLYEKAFMQTDVPIKNSSFTLSCPKHLKFDFKSYQGFPDVKSEEKEEENIYAAEMTDVPAMKEEGFSYFSANLKRIEFKLAYNTARSQARLYTWDDAAKSFYKRLTTLEKNDEKALDKFAKTLNDNPSAPLASRIRSIDQKLKTSIQINEENRDATISEIEAIVKYKIASPEGITKLYIGVFDRLKIQSQVVVTCSREVAKFDGAFDSWGFLDDYVLYFPDTKEFLSPYKPETRYPLIPANFTATKGLFIEPLSIGEVKSALGSIHDIPATSYKLNYDNLNIHVDFNADASDNQIKMKRSFSGYNASSITPYFHLMNEDQRKSMVEELTKQIAPDPKFKSWTIKPVTEALVDEFLIDVDFQSAHFIEKAGSRLLFKVGELIGPQVEMYRDDQRLTDIENDYNRGYDRVIEINIPDGYTVKNAQDLIIDVTYKEGDEEPFLFKSSYTIEGNKLIIKINEYYKEIYAPLSRYEDYRKVINASADFNKVTLVLEKKK